MIDLASIEEEIILDIKKREVKDDFQLIFSLHQNEQPCVFSGGGANNIDYCFHEKELREIIDHIHIIGTNPAFRPILTHRKKFQRTIVFIKRLIRKLVKWYVEPITDQQSDFNQSTVMLTSRIIDEIRDLANYLQNIATVTNGISSYETSINSMHEIIQNLQVLNHQKDQQITNLANRIKALERELKDTEPNKQKHSIPVIRNNNTKLQSAITEAQI